MYRAFKDQKISVDAGALGSAASEAWTSFLGVLPYLLIILACIIAAVLIGKFYGNVSKISELGKEMNTAPN